MKKTIVQLWHGNLEPFKSSGQNNPELKQLESLMQRSLDTLEGSLDEQALNIFEKYNDCVYEYIMLSREEAFCDGFCLGARLLTEALAGEECDL